VGGADERCARVRPPQLAAGKITQAEYDELAGGISEEEYLTEQTAEPEMSADAQKIMKGMKSSSGVEFAPWMKVDAEAIAKAKKERELRKAKAAANAMKSDSMLIDPQAAELGGACTPRAALHALSGVAWRCTMLRGARLGIAFRRRPARPAACEGQRVQGQFDGVQRA
jgi:hypothetical protein